MKTKLDLVTEKKIESSKGRNRSKLSAKIESRW